MIIQSVIDSLSQTFKGDKKILKKVLAVWLSGGHLLLNDRPGTGKTTLAKALSISLAADFKRIQFTPDVTPSDITGINIYNQEKRVWEFHKGPIFSNIILADEINRAPPRTQSSLLEAMEEKQVSVDGKTYKLSENFFVIATQNPLDFEGTYPLPEAQNDRFSMRLSLGYLDEVSELEILLGNLKSIQSSVAIVQQDDWAKLQQDRDIVKVDKDVAAYILRIIRATREEPNLISGSSIRGGLALLNVAKSYAFINGKSAVVPDDIYDLAKDVLCHRIQVKQESYYQNMTPETIIDSILKNIDPHLKIKE